MARFNYLDQENEAMSARLAKMLSSIQAANERMASEKKRLNTVEDRRLEKQAYSEGTNVQSGALKGASLGAVAGPWGALIGGIAGLTGGAIKAYKTRKGAGQSTGSAIWRTAGDVLNPVESGSQLMDAVQAPGGEARLTSAMAPLAQKGAGKFDSYLKRRAINKAIDNAASSASDDYLTGMQRANPVGTPVDMQPGETEEEAAYWDYYNRPRR